MKMKSLFIFIISPFLFIFSCKTLFSDEKLTLQKRDYTGKELKTEGYYYAYFSQTDITAVLFLYRNGIVLSEGGYSSKNLDVIEKKIINGNFKSKEHWGVFIVEGNKIQWERWIGSTGIGACLSKSTGYILNDTTIRFTERYNSEYKTTSSIDEVWHFKQFSPKPDSTNRFIP